MSRCRPCRKRRPVDRELLIARVVYWLPVLSDAELEAVARMAEQLGVAAETSEGAESEESEGAT